MKDFTKNILPCLFMAIILFSACRKDKVIAKKITTVVPPQVNVPEKALLPTQMGTGKTKMLFDYTADYSLKKIEYGDGTSDVLNYDSKGKPSIFEHFQGSRLVFSIEYGLNKNGQVTRADHYAYPINGEMEGTGYFTFTYEDSGQISSISEYNNTDLLISQRLRTYASEGNLLSEKNSSAGMVCTYIFDDKNGLFKSTSYAWLFALERENSLFLSATNNVQSYSNALTPDSSQTFGYKYNTDKYPESISLTMNGKTTSSTVTYKQLK